MSIKLKAGMRIEITVATPCFNVLIGDTPGPHVMPVGFRAKVIFVDWFTALVTGKNGIGTWGYAVYTDTLAANCRVIRRRAK